MGCSVVMGAVCGSPSGVTESKTVLRARMKLIVVNFFIHGSKMLNETQLQPVYVQTLQSHSVLLNLIQMYLILIFA